MQAEEKELALALRGGLHGRFRSSFHLLENALEVLTDQMQRCVTPAQYQTLQPLLTQIQEQLVLLRRLGEHSADAAVAPMLRQICTPRPMDLLGQLRDTAELFNEIAVQEELPLRAAVEAGPETRTLLTMGDDILCAGLLANLLSNSVAERQTAHITLACAPGAFCYLDDGPGMEADARALLQEGTWSDRLLEQGGLGLPLVRAYAAAMGWQIQVGEGPGTQVEFTLPPCQLDVEDMVLESAGALPHLRQRRRQDLQRELFPAIQAAKVQEEEGTT